MIVKIKKTHPNAKIPKYAKEGDAGMDLTAIGFAEEGMNVTYHTGLSVEIPPGYVGLLFPRSSVYKKDQTLTNSVGVIDAGYRGEIMMKFTRSVDQYCVGDRIGQLIIMPFPKIQFEEVNTLTETERSGGGFGSTGN
jgi:dUTP pyrophosphatase